MLKTNGLIVILGSPNDEHGNLTTMGTGRLELGLKKYLERLKDDWKILLTGGFGEHFNNTDKPHAFYSKQILLSKGVSEHAFVDFALSRNTVDDALQARPIVEKHGLPELLVISSDFHMSRVELIFERVFPDCTLHFLGAKYIETVMPAERERLIQHEERELENLKKHGE